MKSARSALAAENQAVNGQPAEVSRKPDGDLGAFLVSLATLLRESVARLEETAGRVSDLVVAHTGHAGPDLIVALQDFDRLQQEFSALGDVLSRMGVTTGGPWPGKLAVDELKHELLKTVTIAELRQRLSLHFEQAGLEPEIMTLFDDEMVAEF